MQSSQREPRAPQHWGMAPETGGATRKDTSDSGSFIFQPHRDTEDRGLDAEAEGGLCT